MSEPLTLYNATTAQEIYDLVATGLSVNTHSAECVGGYYNTTPLHSACKRENYKVVKAICKSGLNKEYLNLRLYMGTPIVFAARKGNLKIIKYLISIGSNVNDVLVIISGYGYEDILDYILTLEIDLNINYNCATALCCACRYGNINFIEKLLINGANPNNCDICDEYPLMSLASTYYTTSMLHICKLLVVYGANFYQINKNGCSALHILSKFINSNILFIMQTNDRIETLKFLVGIGCDINLQNFEGKTPLQCVTNQSSEVVEEYIKLGANIA